MCNGSSTEVEHVKLFKKSLIRGFSCINTRLAFDAQVLLTDKENEKLIFNLEIDGKKQKKNISTKILKIDKNNQYGQAMTKPLPYGCIKKEEHTPSILEFNKILDSISHEDSRGHLFIVDIKFHHKNEKTLLFNKIYPPIFEKKKKKKAVPKVYCAANEFFVQRR